MVREDNVSENYSHGGLLDAIQAGISRLGKSVESVTVDDLGPVDEFHIGGRAATEHFLGRLDIPRHSHILDVGCGLGGTARFLADRYAARVTGIDLTQEYVDTGNVLCRWVQLDDRVTLHCGSALDMPFDSGTFDGACMLHVGMNIGAKAVLFSEVARVLRPGGYFGIYDIMRYQDGKLAYPVPWASSQDICRLATPAEYGQALNAAGLKISETNDRGEFALAFFRRMQEKMKGGAGPPPLGLHTLMQESSGEKIKNMIDNIAAGFIRPVEMIARKP